MTFLPGPLAQFLELLKISVILVDMESDNTKGKTDPCKEIFTKRAVMCV